MMLGDNAAAIEIAQPRWAALEGAAGSGPALLRLGGALFAAYVGLGRFDLIAPYTDRAILIAEERNDPEALAAALRRAGTALPDTWAPRSPPLAHYRASAEIAREHGLQDALAGALSNQVTVEFGHDLDAALGQQPGGRRRRPPQRRATSIDVATGNLMLSLWTAGRLTEVRDLHAAATHGPS